MLVFGRKFFLRIIALAKKWPKLVMTLQAISSILSLISIGEHNLSFVKKTNIHTGMYGEVGCKIAMSN